MLREIERILRPLNFTNFTIKNDYYTLTFLIRCEVGKIGITINHQLDILEHFSINKTAELISKEFLNLYLKEVSNA